MLQKFIGKIQNISFAPSVERIKENAFLPDHPAKLLKIAEPIPVIAGYNNKEGRLACISKFGFEHPCTNITISASSHYAILPHGKIALFIAH